MADFSTLIATLQATIKTNYNQEITGQILQDDLLAMVNTINQLKQDTLEGYGFYGAPLADGASVNVTQNTFFLVGPGTYTINGKANTIAGAGISVLVYDSVNDEVRVDTLISYDTTPTAASKNAITSGAVHTALAAKQDKDADAVAGNVAVMNASGDSEDGGTPLSDLATKAEVAVVAGEAGLAEAVIDTDGVGTEQEFTFRKSGGDGGAYYRKIKGKTIAWNQLTYIKSQTLITSTQYSAEAQDIPLVAGHKYYISAAFSGVNNLIGFGLGHPGYFSSQGVYVEFSVNGRQSVVGTFGEVPGSSSIHRLIFMLMGSGSVEITADNLMCVDLTLAGLADEISTPADFEALYPDYHPYNPGTLKSNDAEAVETTGVNQWDEEWGAGKEWNEYTGELEPTGIPRIYNLHPVSVLPSTQYYGYIAGAGYIYPHFYDADMNYLDNPVEIRNGVFTTPANARYMNFHTYGYGTTYNHDICINLSNPAINGQYFPFWKRTLQLGITTRKDTDGNVPFADGMKGAGTAADWADKVGGEKRMGRINLGDLNWDYYSGAGHELMIARDLVGFAKGVATSAVANLSCSIFTAATVDNLYDHREEGIGINIEGQIDIYVANMGSDPAAFKAAMQGVMLDFELATPVPFTWAEPLNLGVKVDENGTERAVAPEGATAPSAPFVADTTYTKSVEKLVAETSAAQTKADVLALVRANEDALLSALKTAEVITDYTLADTADADTGIFAVVINPE